MQGSFTCMIARRKSPMLLKVVTVFAVIHEYLELLDE